MTTAEVDAIRLEERERIAAVFLRLAEEYQQRAEDMARTGRIEDAELAALRANEHRHAATVVRVLTGAE